MAALFTGPALPNSHAAPFRNSRLASSLYAGFTAHARFLSASSLSRKQTAGGESTEKLGRCNGELDDADEDNKEDA